MYKNIALACVFTVFGMLLIEICIHVVVPLGHIRGSVVGTYPTNNVPRHEISGFGSMFQPNATGTSQYYCYETPIHTNEFGFHDTTWPTTLSGGMALIGDSFVRSEQVPISSTTASLLRTQLGVPVVSAGNNTLGTLGEIELYRTYLKPLHPSVVVLFFFPGNDISDNNCVHNTQSRCATINTDGSLTLENNDEQVPQSYFAQFIRKYCFSCNIIRNKFNSLFEPRSTSWTDDAWRITEIALEEFQKELEKNDSALVVVIVPGGDVSNPYQTGDEKKVIALTKKLGIEILELRQEFSAYIKKFEVPAPFLSFWCDAHWNPVGHYLAAQSIATYIQKNYPSFSTKIQKNLKEQTLQSPQSILGDTNFNAIYDHGVYTPHVAE